MAESSAQKKNSLHISIGNQQDQGFEHLFKKLESFANADTAAGMARYGINPENLLGVSVRDLRLLAKDIGKNNQMAARFWETGIHEARILASMIDNPAEVTRDQMETWAACFDSWDICDQCCNNLFRKTPHALEVAFDWCSREEEFTKRASFVLMAVLSVHEKTAEDSVFESMLPLIRRESSDERNLVRKAVNWALRQIGKRNARLNGLAIALANQMAHSESRAAQWVARDALLELQSDWLQEKLGLL